MDAEEDALLASLQASRHDQDVYEDQVIRQATHQLAPTLTGVGFPSLQTLVHTSSQRNHSDLPQLRAVLLKTRKAHKEENDRNASDMLHLKEQMLLEYMQTVAQMPQEDLPLRTNEARWLEKRRKQVLEKRNSPPEPKEKEPAVEKRSRVSFAPAPETTNSTNMVDPVRKARVSIMKRKQVALGDEHGSDNDSKEISQEAEKQKKELKLLRKARQKRKAARRRAWQEESAASSSEEEEFEARPKKQIAIKEETTTTTEETNEQESLLDDNESDNAQDVDQDCKPPAKVQSPASDLTCPLCQASVEYETEAGKDAALSSHIDSCQRASRRTRRQTARLQHSQPDSEEEEELLQEFSAKQKTATAKSESKKRKRPITVAVTPKTSPALDDREEWVYEDRVDEWIENGLDNMRSMAELDNANGKDGLAQDFGNGLVIPAWVYDRLFGYQREGLKFMWGWHLQEAGGILGDEMGLGKTVSMAAFLGSMASCRKIQSVLLIVPATMLHHWLTELAIWAPGIRRVLIHQSGEVDGIPRTISAQLLNSLIKWLRRSRANRVYECIDEEDRTTMPPHSFCGTGYAIITTYENFRRNPDTYLAHNFSYVVLDEAQKIKNAESDITIAIKRVRTPHRIAMSGTPIMNDLNELWSLFDFVFPGRLGTLPAFQQEFADPIRKGGYSNASPMQVQLAYRCALVLKDLIEPYLLRRLKKDVKEVSRMPTKTEHVLFCRLSPQQRSLYEAYLQSDGVSKVMRGSGNLLSAVTMLRKICNHPDLVCDPSDMSNLIKNGFAAKQVGTSLSEDEEEEDDEELLDEETLMERSGKLEVMSKILPLWKKQGHRVLIFCQWRKMLNIVQRLMMIRGWKFGRLDGNTNVAARQRLVDSFNSDESYFAMLSTTRVGGVGVNLTGASRVIVYSPDWNPQVDAQARERAWRFGQQKPVTVFRLITAGSIEEKIYQRQIFKTALSNRVLQDPRQRRLFSQRDLHDLFTLKRDTGSIKSGGDGVTETGEMTRGQGVVDVDSQEDQQNLKDVMKSRGLAGIFDHDFVEEASTAKTATAREMEQQAKKVAQEAVKALQNSVASAAPQQRFGGNQTQRFGSANNPGFGSGGSSASLLGSLQKRANTVELADLGVESKEQMSEYTQLLRRIKVFVKRRQPSTDAILKEFADVPNDDVAIFRRLLKIVAKLENGRWIPKG